MPAKGVDRIRRRTFLKSTGAGVGVGLTAGCMGGGGDEDTITIAGLQPYSGPFALYGDAHTAGVEFAMQEINDDGGLLDKELEHVAEDTGSEPSEAATILNRLVEREGAVAALGPVSSDVGVLTSENAEELEVPLYLHTAGDIEILSRDSRYTFRTALPPAPAFIQAVADIIEGNGYETVGAINADYAWGEAAEAAIERTFPDGIDLTMRRAPAGESNFSPYLRDMPGDLEVLVGSGHPPGLNDMFSQMLEVGLEPDLMTGAVDPPETNYNGIGDDVANGFTFGHLPDVYSDEYREIADRFYEETGGYFGPTQAAGYVTVHLIAEAIRQEESDDAADIAAGTRQLEYDTIYAEPIQYTEWGELQDYSLIWSGFELEAPEYYPDGDFDLHEAYRTDTLSAIDPEEW
ncbi:ABC transporter substrate-binding protein [Natrinema salifodinae]|uniref:Branched-chain amino acid transport system substrate-binding protein n=1 Tax=Natrinema salifodinae TaxID=1202768 RepID=A0A1I0LXK8_9EURY|nr:ABC transporter substrate-binding protein [Natrinema salifodinae]SEV80351.1 branched-chain amino acid transport system substrate-binding protein [Natrinema salifodinae]